MAPSRKRSANKAATAAAARRKWKVGDLVLAKVKGFPAWPAMVSEPEKWEFQPDCKKVFVHFFGTQQIAFCQPVDVEEFTEEKKVALLGKRHAKGADFVRAVTEITNCFEDWKKQDEANIDGAEETSFTNENPDKSLTKPENDKPLKDAIASGVTDDLISRTKACVAADTEEDLHDEEMQLDEEHSDLLFTETPVSTSYSTRSKTDAAAQSKNGSKSRNSARSLRSSTKMDGNERMKLPSINNRGSRSSGPNSSHDRSLRKSRRFRISSNDSGGPDIGSPASVSDDNLEKNSSEIVTEDSGTQTYNGGSSVDSRCKPVAAQPSKDNNEAETELSNRLDFQTNTIIIKKKRKPTRKRQSNNTVFAAKLDIVASEAEVPKIEYSPKEKEKLIKRPAQDDGDEHLPLAKRARIRMGGPSRAEEQEDTFLDKEEKMLTVMECPKQSNRILNMKADAPPDVKSYPMKRDPPNFSTSHVGPEKPQYWETRKNFVDGEAALPPSKRLHRALEAMSANVAADSHRASIFSPEFNINGDHCSSLKKCSELSKENITLTDLESETVEDHVNGTQLCAVPSIEMPKDDTQNFIVVSDSGKEPSSIGSLDVELNKYSSKQPQDGEGKHLKMLRTDEQPAGFVDVHHVKPYSSGIHGEQALLSCNAAGLTMSATFRGEMEGLKHETDIPQFDRCPASVKETVGGSHDIDINIETSGSHDIDINIETSGSHDTDINIKTSPADSKGDEIYKYAFLEKVAPISAAGSAVASATHVTALTSSNPFRSNPVSISDDQLGDITVSVSQSSSSLNNISDSVAKVSPPVSSISMPASAKVKNRSIEKKSSRSPDAQLYLQKVKLAGKSSSKTESLLSFESALRSLTRNKESIGRTTRIAIECAKLGCATKVVEILARNLERESSSHRKVDLFFLVDSITQFSRGLKGDGGIYPSTIQALLPRLLLAAAPPGSISHENHRQCLKVLRVWQDRKILPEAIVRHHIQELDALFGSYPNAGSRRALRNERSFDDPIREMEGMLVDEYGSNSSIQLPGFCMPPMLRDDDGRSDSDGESFEAVTPEHNDDGENTAIPAVVKRSHILEDVDGELEMEDVAPCCEVASTCISDSAAAGGTKVSHQFAPQQSMDIPLTSALPPRTLPPPPPPPPPPHPVSSSAYPPAVCDSTIHHSESKRYSSSQASMVKVSGLPRVDKDFEVQIPRQMADSSNIACFSDRPQPNMAGRANGIHPADTSKGFHLRPPRPAPSDQFSYVQDQRRRDIPPPSQQPNRFHTRNVEYGNYYRERDKNNKFAGRDNNIGECWRPPLPSISGPFYQDGARMPHASMSYPREPPLPTSNRWNCPPRSTNNRHFNPFRPPCETSLPVANRGPNYWKPR